MKRIFLFALFVGSLASFSIAQALASLDTKAGNAAIATVGNRVIDKGVVYDKYVLSVDASKHYGITVLAQSGLPETHFGDVQNITDEMMTKARALCLKEQCAKILVVMTQTNTVRVKYNVSHKDSIVRVDVSVPTTSPPTFVPLSPNAPQDKP